MNEAENIPPNNDLSDEWAAAIPDNDPHSIEHLSAAEQVPILEFKFAKLQEMIEDEGFEDFLRSRANRLEARSFNLLGTITHPEELIQAKKDFEIISDMVNKLEAFKARMLDYRRTTIHLPDNQRLPVLKNLVDELRIFMRQTLLYLDE